MSRFPRSGMWMVVDQSMAGSRAAWAVVTTVELLIAVANMFDDDSGTSGAVQQ